MPITDPNLSVGDERDGFRVIKVVNGPAAKYIWSRIATTSVTPTTGTASVLAWAPATAYVAGQTVTTAAGVWRRTADGTSGAAFDAAEQANWSLVANLISGVQIDKTPATIPASLAALTTAVPPTAIPSNEVWTSIFGVPGDYQSAQVISGVWTVTDRPANTASVTPTPIPADVTALETAVPAAGKPAGITWIATIGTPGNFRQATVVNGAWQVGATSGAGGTTMVGASNTTAGVSGLVPTPTAGQQHLVLRGDGTWGPAFAAWQPSIVYSAGAMVTANGSLWSRISAGLSGLTFDSNEQGGWTALGGSGAAATAMTGASSTVAGTAGSVPTAGIGTQDLAFHGDGTFKTVAPDWVASRAYSAGALAVSGGVIYRRITAGTSAASFAADAVNWLALGAAGGVAMVGATAGVAGTAGTVPVSTAGAQDTVLHADGQWRQVAPDWTASTPYSAGALAVNGGVLYRRIAAGTSAASFAADTAAWTALGAAAAAMTGATGVAAGTGGSVPVPAVASQDLFLAGDATFKQVAPDWVTGRSYSTGALAVNGGTLYRRIGAGVSGATFAADAPNWTALGAAGANRLYLSNASVIPAVNGQPTVAEITAAVGANRDMLVIYNGTNNVAVPADPTHVFWVDAAGVVTTLRSPQTSAAMTGATALAAGTAGTAPAPGVASQDLFLAGDATYKQLAPDWVASRAYSAGALAVNAGTLYRRIAAGTSGATFDAAEQANWTAVTSLGANRLHLTNAAVAPAIAGQPTNAEALAAVGATRNVIAYFTGSNVATDPPTHVWHVDAAGTITLLRSPQTATAAMTAATGAVAGGGGTVPAPAAGQQGLFLRGDASYAAVIGAFAASTAYSAGAVIATPEGIWTRTAAGTSGLTFDAAEQANWMLRANVITDPLRFRGGHDASTAVFPGAGSAQAGDYYRITTAGTINGTAFNVGDSVFAITDNASAATYANNWLRVAGSDVAAMGAATGTTAGTSGTVPAPAIGQQDMILFGDATWRGPIGDWAATRAYSAGAVIVNGRRIYRRLTAGTSTATFAGDLANWAEIGSVGGAVLADTATAVAETALTGMADGDVTFRTDTGVWRIYDADAAAWRNLSTPTAVMTGATATVVGTGGSTPIPAIGAQDLFLKADGTWSGLVPDWTAARAYSAGAIVTNGGTIYRRTAAGTSGATFDAAELATWTALSAPPEVAVVTRATTNSPTVNRFNIYPNGATIGAAPTVVTGAEYTTAIMNAAGTGYASVARFIERSGAWVPAEANASAIPLDFDLGIVSWWPGNTVPSDAFIPASGGTFNDTDYPHLAAKIQAGGLAGFTKTLGKFTVPDLNTTGRFIRALGGQPAGTLQDDATAVNGLRLAFTDGGGGAGKLPNFADASGVNASTNSGEIVSADTETRPINVSYLAVIRAKPFVTTVASGGTLTINNLIPAPKRTITVTVNGAAGTIRGAANWIGYEGQTAGIRVDIPAGHYVSAAVGTQSSGTALTAGQVAIAVAEAGTLAVTLGDGDMAIAVTTVSQSVAITANGAALVPAVAAKINSTHTVRLPIPAGQEIDISTVLPVTAIVSDIVTGAATVVVGTTAVDVVYSTRTRTTLTDTAQAGVYTWEVKPLATAGGAANDLVAATTVGTAHALNATNGAVLLQPGYTWEISAEVTRHGGNPGWTTHSINIDGTNVGNSFYSGVSGTNWYGGGATTHIVTIPSTGTERAVRVHRVSSSGNGDTSGNLVVRAIAKEGNTTLPAAWPQRTITATIDGVAATFQTRASVTGYDNQTIVCDLDLAAGRSITSVTASSGVAEIVMGHAGLISVTPNGGNVVLTAVTSPAATYNSLQQVADVTGLSTVLSATAVTVTLPAGINLVAGDLIELGGRYNSATTENYTGWVRVVANQTSYTFGYGSTNHLKVGFPASLANTFTIATNGSANDRLIYYRIWRSGASGYVVPTGTTVAAARSVTATVNAVAANVDGAPTVTAYEAIGKVIQVALGAGRRLATVTASAGATANIVDPVKGLVYVVMAGADSVLTCVDALAATYKGLQKIHPTYFPGGGTADINNTTFTTNVDLTDPAIEQVTFHFADQTTFRPWPSATMRLRDTRVNGDTYIVWNYSNGYIDVTITNHATGTFVMTDTNRGAALRAIDYEGMADLGLVVPTATTVAAEVDITVNAGAVEIDGVLGAHKILTGVGAYHLTATLPAGQWVDAEAFTTANAANGAKLIDRRTGEFSIQVPIGGANTNVTMAFVAQQQTAAVLTLTGSMVTNDGVHNVTDLTAFTRVDNEGSGLVVGNDSTVTISRTMVLAVGLSVESSEGSGLVLWPRISLDRNDGDGFTVVSEDNHGNPASGAEQWVTQYGPFRAVAGSKLRFDCRVSGPYSGGRPGTIWIRELAPDNGFVLPAGTSLANARNITAVVDSVAAQIDGTAGVVAYQQIGKTVQLTIPVGRQLDTVSATGGAVVNVSDRMRGLVYIVAGAADSIVTAATVPAATYTGLQKVAEWLAPDQTTGLDIEATTINTGINMTNVDWLVVTYGDNDSGNGYRKWPAMWIPISEVADNVDIWYNARNVGYGRYKITSRVNGTMAWEDDDGAIRIFRIEAWNEASNGFVVPTASTLHTGRTITLMPGTQIIQGLENQWQIVRLNSLAATDQVATVAATGGANTAIVDAQRGLIAVQPGAANTVVTATTTATGADFIRVLGNQDLSGIPFVSTVGGSTGPETVTVAIPSAGIWRATIAGAAWDNDTSGNAAVRIDLLDAGSAILDSTVIGIGTAHSSGVWFSLGSGILRANLPAAGNYRIRMSNTTNGEVDGMAIVGLVFEKG